jgi:hypothetical protein
MLTAAAREHKAGLRITCPIQPWENYGLPCPVKYRRAPEHPHRAPAGKLSGAQRPLQRAELGPRAARRVVA